MTCVLTGLAQLALVLTFASYGNAVECGVAPNTPGAAWIVGGQRSEKHEWPWVVSVFDTEADGHYCGATLISNTWVLTAAHCVYYMGQLESASIKKVIVSEHDTRTDEVNDYVVNVRRIVPHRGYNDDTVVNDIALLQLEESVPWTDEAIPICIPKRFVGYNRNCTSVGWGETQGTGKERFLNEVVLPTVSNGLCKRQLGEPIRRTHMCAARKEGGKDTCQGDSGGPLMCEYNGKWYQQGIVSWGFGCGDLDSPGVYTRVHKYLRWIKSVTKVKAVWG